MFRPKCFLPLVLKYFVVVAVCANSIRWHHDFFSCSVDIFLHIVTFYNGLRDLGPNQISHANLQK